MRDVTLDLARFGRWPGVGVAVLAVLQSGCVTRELWRDAPARREVAEIVAAGARREGEDATAPIREVLLRVRDREGRDRQLIVDAVDGHVVAEGSADDDVGLGWQPIDARLVRIGDDRRPTILVGHRDRPERALPLPKPGAKALGPVDVLGRSVTTPFTLLADVVIVVVGVPSVLVSPPGPCATRPFIFDVVDALTPSPPPAPEVERLPVLPPMAPPPREPSFTTAPPRAETAPAPTSRVEPPVGCGAVPIELGPSVGVAP